MITDQGQNLMAGIRQVSSGDTETQLNALLDILSKIEESLQDTNSVFQDYRVSAVMLLKIGMQ